jgi:hypothetical protein
MCSWQYNENYLNHYTENCTLYWNLFGSIVHNQDIMTPRFPPHSKSPTVWTEIKTLLLFHSTRHGSIRVIISRIYMSYRVMITYDTAYFNVVYISGSADLILIILFYFVKNFYARFQFVWYNLKVLYCHHVCNFNVQRIINMYLVLSMLLIYSCTRFPVIKYINWKQKAVFTLLMSYQFSFYRSLP